MAKKAKTDQAKSKWDDTKFNGPEEGEQSTDALADEQQAPLSSEHEPMVHELSAEEMQRKISELEEQLHDSHDQFVRAKAEAQNAIDRSKKDVQDAHKYGLKRFFAELLPVIDSLEKALEVEVGDDEVAQNVHKGVELTLQMMHTACKKFGIETIDPSQGDKFDPAYHEAISMQPTAEVEPNRVMTVVQKGYQLNGRVVRSAKVVISQKTA